MVRPTSGAEYSKDAYVQNELALIALKLAVDVMGKGATFVSKVFRSQDYNALVWVFKQLFKKVSATKPLSSRNESAEIFVVCEDYLAPHSIDPKLLDPEHVFSALEKDAEGGLTIFHPKYGQQKRHREGTVACPFYLWLHSLESLAFVHSSIDTPVLLVADSTIKRCAHRPHLYVGWRIEIYGISFSSMCCWNVRLMCLSRLGYDDELGQTLTRVKSITEFVESNDPIRLLTDCTSFKFEEADAMFLEHAATTTEVKACLADLKVRPNLYEQSKARRGVMTETHLSGRSTVVLAPA